ncbi:MAG: two-component system response regulator HydG [Saprospiraceae bacterium]|jgi:two-component system response regulator HydG
MKTDATILIIDDEEDILFSLRMLLRQHYAKVYSENNPYHIPRSLHQYNPEIVLLDMNFKVSNTKGEEGLHWLKKIKELKPDLPVIMMTAFSDIETAISAIKNGATDFVEKPWRNEKLIATVNAALTLSHSTLALQRAEMQQEFLQKDIDQSFGEIIGTSTVINDLKKVIEKVAPTDANILLLGENGTGKELIARMIHKISKRKGKIFMGVDLGAITETLFESELFGHVKGAFTGADKNKIGRFEAASGGTLFLDEIGNLPISSQPKLLQTLENKQIFPVGSANAIPVDVRIISATNMPLAKMIEENSFREDLLYRINTVEISIPPLRERGNDIIILAEHFLNLYRKKYLKESLTFHEDTLNKLMEYPWYGNIRELQHSVERAIILSESKQLMPADFALVTKSSSESEAKEIETLNLEEVEAITVRKALIKHHGNISKAAAELGLTRPALYRRMDKYGL